MRNCAVLSLSTTVRPTRPVRAAACQVRAASSRMAGSSASSGRSWAKVSSEDTDCTGWSGSTGRSSMPRARRYNVAPKLPKRSCSTSSGSARSSPTVVTPSACRRSRITRPTPGMRSTGSGVRKRSTWCGRTTNRPSGLRQSEAILARNLLGATPAEAVRASSSRICRRMVSATAVAVDDPDLGTVTSR